MIDNATRTLVTARLLAFFLCLPFFANAQTDLSGSWIQHTHEDWQEQADGPHLVDFLGLPLNKEGRMRGLAFSSSLINLPERQCLYYAPHYLMGGLFGMAIWQEADPVSGDITAWHIGPTLDRGHHVIYMDGRDRPTDLEAHLIGGFALGEWQGNTLKAVFTDFREGYIRRNGAPSSDRATFTMWLTRNGNILTLVGEVDDPVYLEEPLVQSRVFTLDEGNASYVNPTSLPCFPAVEVPSLDGSGQVPHYLPGQNPFLTEFADTYGLELETVLGGAETMYPEYREQIRDTYRHPQTCGAFCCSWSFMGFNGIPGCVR
ncbi:MAG: hypothetical protein PVF50_07050 [Gammaproteobacteria bacterium]